VPVISSTKRGKGEEGASTGTVAAQDAGRAVESEQASAPSIFINQLFQELSATP